LVKPQLAQALLERPPGLVGPMLAVGELGGDEDLVARQFAAWEGLPDALLVLISLSGVDQPVSGGQSHGDRLGGLLRRHEQDAVSQLGDQAAIVQRQGGHCGHRLSLQ
jgi:hypothetical protein